MRDDLPEVKGFRLEFYEEKDGKKYALQAEHNAVTVKVKNSTNNNLTIVS